MPFLRVMPEEKLGQRLAKRIERIAKSQGIDQKELLKRAALPDGSKALGATAFNFWKSGKTSPTIERLEALCEVIQQKLDVRIGAGRTATRRPSLEPESLEAAEWINMLETEAERVKVRETVERMVRAMNEKRASASG